MLPSAVVNVSANGNNTIVAAVAGKKIRVLGYALKASAAVNFQWKSSGGTAIDGLYEVTVAGDGLVLPIVPPMTTTRGYDEGWFETLVGEGLVLNLSGAVQVGGVVKYRLVE